MSGPKLDDLLLEYQALTPEPKRTPRWITFQQQYRDDPVAFTHDCFNWEPGQGPAEYQDEIMDLVARYPRVSVRAPHGTGKSSNASWLIWWFALTRDGLDWKCPTTASNWRQLTKFLWPEIHKWGRQIRWEIVGRERLNHNTELLSQNFRLETGEALAMASDDETAMEGAHADNMLFLFDESKAIKDATFDALEGAFSTTGDIKVLAISTPGPPHGRFYNIHRRAPGYEDWVVKHVTLDEAIRAGRISKEWADKRREQWGESSAVYQNRVLGEFADDTGEGVIPTAWIRAAQERWKQITQDDWDRSEPICVSCDVARGGADQTVKARRRAVPMEETELNHLLGFPVRVKTGEAPLDAIKVLDYTNTSDTMQTAGEVQLATAEEGGGYQIIDSNGLGAGVYDRLNELDQDVKAFSSAQRTDQTDRSGELGFINIRAAAWWQFRERLDPATGSNVALPPDDTMLSHLSAPTWKVTSGAKIQIESKESMKKRLGWSPDAGDAVVMAYWNPESSEIEFY